MFRENEELRGARMQTLRWPAVLAVVLSATAVTAWVIGSKGGPMVRRSVLSLQQQWRIAAILREEWQALAAGGERLTRGDGPVRLVVMSNYTCSACRQLYLFLDSLSQAHPRVVVAFRHVTPVGNVTAQGAARTAVCAGIQGRFANASDHLYRTTEWMNDTNWVRVARVAGVPDRVSFEGCIASSLTAKRLAADRVIATKLGFGAPALVTSTSLSSGIAIRADLVAFFKSQEQS